MLGAGLHPFKGRQCGALQRACSASCCASANADFTVVHGRVVVRQGHLATVDLGPLIERHNALAQQLAAQAR